MALRHRQPGHKYWCSWTDCGPDAAKRQKLEMQAACMRPIISGGQVNQSFLMSHQPNKFTVTPGSVPGVMANPPRQGSMVFPALHGGRNTISEYCSQNQKVAQSKSHAGGGLLPDPFPNWPARSVLGDRLLPDPVPCSLVSSQLNVRKDCLASDGNSDVDMRMDTDMQHAFPKTMEPDNSRVETVIVESSTDSSKTIEGEQSKQEQNQHAAEMQVRECKFPKSSAKDCASHDKQAAVGVLPEIPAEREINRITAELTALEVRFNQVMNASDMAPGARGKQIRYIKGQQRKLKIKLKKERQKQHERNLQLSYQLQEQYKISLGLNPKESNLDERKQTEDEATIGVLLNEYGQLKCEIAKLDFKVDDLQSEERELTEQETQTLKSLIARKTFLGRKAEQVWRSRERLLKKTTKRKLGIDPLYVLGRFAKHINLWRDLRRSGVNLAQEKLCENGIRMPLEDKVKKEGVDENSEVGVVSTSKTQQAITSIKPMDEEVIVISDEEGQGQDDLTELSCAGQADRSSDIKTPQQWNPLLSYVKPHSKKKVRDIDMCVKERNMMADADQSYFLLSGLASVLLAQQRTRKLGHLHHQTRNETAATTSSPGETSALCQLIGQMSSKLGLASMLETKAQQAEARIQQAKEHIQQQRVERERIDLYLKIHKDSKSKVEEVT